MIAPATRRAERGFGIVEVLIAAVLITTIVMAVTYAAVGGTRMRSAAKVSSAATAAGKRVTEHLATDRSWMERPDCRTSGMECDLASAVPTALLDDADVGGAFDLVLARSRAVDSDVDKVGTQDTDGVIPDYFRVRLVLRPSPQLTARYGTMPDRIITTAMDRRGASVLGSVAVELCRAVNQHDERMSVQGCRDGGMSSIRMAGCPPVPEPGCDIAWHWVKDRPQSDDEPTGRVVFRRVGGASFVLRSADTGQTWSSAGREVEPGLVVFQNIPVGSYQLASLPDIPGFVRWGSKEIPSFHGTASEPVASSVIVEHGLRSRALVAWRRDVSRARIDWDFKRRTRTYRLVRQPIRYELAVAPWAPTDEYEGDSYAFQDEGGYNTSTMQYEPPNCVVMRMNQGTQWYSDAHGRTVDVSGNVHARACTYYMEQYWHEWYRQSAPEWRTRDGAADRVRYSLEPRPDHRVLERTGPSTVVDVARTCTSRWKQQCTDPAPQMGRLSTGLNSPVTRIATAARINKNEYFLRPPSWLTNGPLWVRPSDGHIIDYGGTDRGDSPAAPVIGMGECYWIYPGDGVERLGSCNPCYPFWMPSNVTIRNACGGVVTKTRWKRSAIERYWMYDRVTGATEFYTQTTLEPAEGTITYEPPLSCDGAPPRLKEGVRNCWSRTRARTYSIPRTRHRGSGARGTGTVRTRVIGSVDS